MTYYANDDERDHLIGELRPAAEFLQEHRGLLKPRRAYILAFPPDEADEEKRAEIDVIVTRTGAETSESTSGRYFCSPRFGPVEYRAAAIPGSRYPGLPPVIPAARKNGCIARRVR